APGIYFTVLELSAAAPEGLAATLTIDGVTTGGVPQTVVLHGRAGDVELFHGEGFPARFEIDAWRLQEGVNELKVIAESGPARAERRLALAVQNIVIHSPAPDETGSGLQVVSFDVKIPEQAIESVQVSVDGNPIYTGEAPPGELTLDTRLLEDG